jgi:acetyl esterase/lipase
LDLYLPPGDGFPMAVFVHGGYWSFGDKGEHANLGVFLARHGVGAALVNYRLSPQVRHPAHAEDAAAAVAWTRAHLGAAGGDAGRLFLFGHSAGAHLVALLATDATLLRPWGLAPDAIRGVIAVSGLYRIHVNVSLCGIGHVFRGADRRAASPLCRVGPNCPPFLILHAQRELWTLTGQARKLHARLQAARCGSRLVPVPGEDHSSIIHTAALPGSPHGREIRRFILDG